MVLITVCTVHAIKKNCCTTPLRTVFSGVQHGVDNRVHGVRHQKKCCTTPLRTVFSGVQHGFDYRAHGVRYYRF